MQLADVGDFTINLHTDPRTVAFAKLLLADVFLSDRSDVGASLHSDGPLGKNKFVKNVRRIRFGLEYCPNFQRFKFQIVKFKIVANDTHEI